MTENTKKRLLAAYRQYLIQNAVLNKLALQPVKVDDNWGLMQSFQFWTGITDWIKGSDTETYLAIEIPEIKKAIWHMVKIDLVTVVKEDDKAVMSITEYGRNNLRNGVYEGLANSSYVAYTSLKMAYRANLIAVVSALLALFSLLAAK